MGERIRTFQRVFGVSIGYELREMRWSLRQKQRQLKISNGLDRCLSSEDEKVVECVDGSGESDDVDIGVPRARDTDDISSLKK